LADAARKVQMNILRITRPHHGYRLPAPTSAALALQQSHHRILKRLFKISGM
jgi:hypothetical protein